VLQDQTDAIVRICGIDLHILKGDVPTVTEGRILGHEGIGVVTKVGAGVSTFHSGDRVLISHPTTFGSPPTGPSCWRKAFRRHKSPRRVDAFE
jgi:alcohol dehydrogenase